MRPPDSLLRSNGRYRRWPLKRMAPGVALKEAVGMAWRALLGHRIRAVLSMLGIIIGIAAVVSAIAIGEGTRRNILRKSASLVPARWRFALASGGKSRALISRVR